MLLNLINQILEKPVIQDLNMCNDVLKVWVIANIQYLQFIVSNKFSC